MKIIYEDKSTKQGVLLKFFIPACFLSVFMLFSAPLTKYGDPIKNDLKWIGVFCGIIFPFTFGLILIYIIKKYKILKRDNL